jgi:hypothetical protein
MGRPAYGLQLALRRRGWTYRLGLPLGLILLVVKARAVRTSAGPLWFGALRLALAPLGVKSRLILATNELSQNIRSRQSVAVGDSCKHLVFFLTEVHAEVDIS